MTYKSSDLFDLSALTLGDTILVVRDGKSYEIDVTEAQDYGLPGDLVLVNRGGVSYNCRFDQIPEDAGITRDTDLILLNRNNKSYRATIGELRGQLSKPVTFNVELRTADRYKRIENGPGRTCEGNNFDLRCSGGKITATVTAQSTSTFTVSSGDLTIDGEWIVCNGEPGEFNTGYSWNWFGPEIGYKTCSLGWDNTSKQRPQGLAAVGVNNKGGGGNAQGYGPPVNQNSGTAGTTGRGGFGCPPGAGGEPRPDPSGCGAGGFMQTRPRAEDSGDTWNGITVVNVNTSTGNWSSYGAISANGKTLTGSGVIGDLLQ